MKASLRCLLLNAFDGSIFMIQIARFFRLFFSMFFFSDFSKAANLPKSGNLFHEFFRYETPSVFFARSWVPGVWASPRCRPNATSCVVRSYGKPSSCNRRDNDCRRNNEGYSNSIHRSGFQQIPKRMLGWIFLVVGKDFFLVQFRLFCVASVVFL